MKLKKLFAGIVAAAMMLTMGATAFAADTGVNASGKVEIKKTYTVVNNNTEAPAATFKLKQIDAVGSGMSDNYGGEVPNLKFVDEANKIVSELEFKNASKETQDGIFEIELDNDAYKKGVGVFTYTLEEVADDVAGVTTDPRQFILTVYVLQKDGGLEKTVTVKEATETGKKKLDSVKNEYKAGTLNIKKIVEGDLGDRNHKFTFTVNLESDNRVASTIYVDGKAKELTWNEAEGKYTATITDIELKHDENVNITNIPYGVTYTVNEVGEKEDGTLDVTTNAGTENEKTVEYTVTYDDAKSAEMADAAKDSKTVITNSAGKFDIDTGVILDNAPYIALLTIVAFGAVALVLNKRRRDEE